MHITRRLTPNSHLALIAITALAQIAGGNAHSKRSEGVSPCPSLSAWQADGMAPPQWQSSPDRSDTVVIADPGSSVYDRSLVSPALQVPTTGLQLRLRQQLQLSWASTLAVLEIRIGDDAWRDLFDGNDEALEGGYDHKAYAGNPLGMRPAWGGQRDWFVTTTELPAAARGRTVQLRLRLASSGSGDAHPGWQVADLICSASRR